MLNCVRVAYDYVTSTFESWPAHKAVRHEHLTHNFFARRKAGQLEQRGSTMTTDSTLRRCFMILFALVLGLGALMTALVTARAVGAAAGEYDCTTASMNVGDCEALVALYENTDGDNWNDNSNWLGDSPCNEANGWFGVSCQGGRVTQITLPENNLHGQLPNELGDLGQLTSLNLFSNTITGTVPTTLMELDTVTFLHLGQNELSGDIPPEFEQMDGLISLYLNQNQFSGSIPETLDNITDLQFLYLHGNMLNGPVPDSLCALNLSNLNLGYNALAIDERSDACLDTFDSTWRETQTVPPSPRFDFTQPGSVQAGYLVITWDLIPFTAGSGFYEVYMGTQSGIYGDQPIARTQTKEDDFVRIDGLQDGQDYFFIMRTQSNVNNINNNIVVSDDSEEISSQPLALSLTDFQASERSSLMLIIAAALLPTLMLSAAAVIGYRFKTG
jgi:hypothetical protein